MPPTMALYGLSLRVGLDLRRASRSTVAARRLRRAGYAVPDCPWWRGPEPAALSTERWDQVYASSRAGFRVVQQDERWRRSRDP